jgi:hypothetical protein
MPFIRPVAFLEHRSEILYEKGGEEQKFGEHTRPGPSRVWRLASAPGAKVD